MVLLIIGVIVILLSLGMLVKFGKRAIKLVSVVAVAGAIFVGITAIKTGSMPSEEDLINQRDEIVAQIKEEVKERGSVPDSVLEKITTYNELLDKAEEFKDNKFIGGLIKYDIDFDSLKIDVNEWL